jgi:hypothetical protein
MTSSMQLKHCWAQLAAESLAYSTDRGRGCSVIVLRGTSKMMAVDQPNINAPFIAVIGPSEAPKAESSHKAC